MSFIKGIAKRLSRGDGDYRDTMLVLLECGHYAAVPFWCGDLWTECKECKRGQKGIRNDRA